MLFLGCGLAVAGFQEPLFELGFTSEQQSTQTGEYLKKTLSDNSVLEINTNSSVSIDFTPLHREVTLAYGEAYFQARAHDPRPFSVDAGDVSVSTVDATFSMRRQPENTVSVSVSRGTVFLHQAMRQRRNLRPFVLEATLVGGYAARLHAGALFLEPFTTGDRDCKWAWRRGQLCLDGETLSEAVAEINRYAEQQWVIGDPSLATLRVGGLFDIARLSGITEALERAFGIVAVARDSKSIVLMPGPPARPVLELHRG